MGPPQLIAHPTSFSTFHLTNFSSQHRWIPIFRPFPFKDWSIKVAPLEKTFLSICQGCIYRVVAFRISCLIILIGGYQQTVLYRKETKRISKKLKDLMKKTQNPNFFEIGPDFQILGKAHDFLSMKDSLISILCKSIVVFKKV